MNRRLYKVNESLREAVSEAVERDVKDPRLGFVTITGVETSPDLRDARVFVSVLGDESRREETLQALRSAHSVLQARIAARVRLKRTPKLQFVYDDTTDRALHINELLRIEADELAARRAAGPDRGPAEDKSEPRG